MLYIDEIECNVNNKTFPYADYPAIYKSFRSSIYCNRSNIKCFNLDYYSNNDTYLPHCKSYYCCPNSGREGNFIVSNTSGCAQSWSIYRVGSSVNSSIKFVNEKNQIEGNPISVGSDIYKGFSFPIVAGSSNVNFYLTTYGYNNSNDIFKYFNVCLTLPNGEEVYSSECGYLSNDNTSVWSGGIENDSDSIQSYVLSIPVDSVEGNVSVMFNYSFYQPGAMMFLDPDRKSVV